MQLVLCVKFFFFAFPEDSRTALISVLFGFRIAGRGAMHVSAVRAFTRGHPGADRTQMIMASATGVC